MPSQHQIFSFSHFFLLKLILNLEFFASFTLLVILPLKMLKSSDLCKIWPDVVACCGGAVDVDVGCDIVEWPR